MEKDSYNDEPVYYCKRCLSLNIKVMPMLANQEYCESCNNADIGTASFEDWDKMYVEKYGHHYIEKRVLKWPYWC